MKKIALATLLALAAISASAVEVGVIGGADTLEGNHTRNTYGLTVGQHFGAFSATAEALREQKGDTNKFNLVGGYDVTKIGTATLTAKIGVAYIDNATINHADRYAGLVGAGISIPVTDKVSATIDYRYQAGEHNYKSFDGSTYLVGAKYSF
jgi:opacity protein-like surface antigen